MKKLLSLLLAIAMVASLAFTVSAAEEYDLWIADVQVTGENLVIDSADNPLITSGSATFDPEEGTLTLDNFVFTSDYDAQVIYASGIDLTIELVGQSVITGVAEYCEVIRVDADLGMGEWTAIVDADETNQGADLIIKGEYNDCIHAENLIIDGCHIEAEALYESAYAIGVYCDMIIKNSVIDAKGYFCGLIADEHLTIIDSDVTVYSQYNAGLIVDLFSYVDDSSVTITNSTVTAFGGAEGLYVPCRSFEVRDSVVTATSNDRGILFGGTEVKLNDADVYLGDAAPGHKFNEPTHSDYQCKYVKIESPNIPKNESTTVTYNVDPAYTVTIPTGVTLGGTAKIEAENVVVPKGKQVEVTISDANDFKVTSAEGAELTYTVTDGQKTIAEGDTVLAVNPTEAKVGEVILSFVAPSDVQYAGTYTGTVTFTIAVKDVTAALISFTIDGVAYQAEAGMTWGEWVESEYDANDKWEWDSGAIGNTDWEEIGWYIVNNPGTTDVWNVVLKNDVIQANADYVLLLSGPM